MWQESGSQWQGSEDQDQWKSWTKGRQEDVRSSNQGSEDKLWDNFKSNSKPERHQEDVQSSNRGSEDQWKSWTKGRQEDQRSSSRGNSWKEDGDRGSAYKNRPPAAGARSGDDGYRRSHQGDQHQSDGARWSGSRACTHPPQPTTPLQKDFYLCHPTFKEDEAFCWGNLQACNPVLSGRTDEEVAAYRISNGIIIKATRGRDPPKPFQSFATETSFPEFVEELAYELFTTNAVPFPVQAQAWPCALSGMDVVAIAPTGSGKTLAFLLPALVHIMAQPPLTGSDGPIALLLAPTRELVQQTHAVAAHFCARTIGEDKLRASAIFGGVSPVSQLPSEQAPDFGRWAELLVATPGRTLDLLVRKWLDASRISYVVFDEADLLLSGGFWVSQIRDILSYIRPDRQLIFCSATWPREAQTVAEELCGAEMTLIRVEPHVPAIPQAIELFPGTCSGEHEPREVEEARRRRRLLDWLRTELCEGEALLVFCASPKTARSLAADPDLAEALAAAGGGGVGAFVPAEGSRGGEAEAEAEAREDRRSSYWDFVHGKIRVLVSTFALASRGLDYSDVIASSASSSGPAPLRLAVLLLDFPRNIKDYCHCIGRTARPGQLDGRAVAFLPETKFWLAKELVAVLEHSGQEVPRELQELVDKDQDFETQCREGMIRLRYDESPLLDEAQGACGGDFDAEHGLWTLPATLPSYRRKLLHWLADELGLPHVSTGEQPSRHLHIARAREDLPERFFMEGEEVMVESRREGGWPSEGIIVDPKIRRNYRTVAVKFRSGNQADIPVEKISLATSDGS